MGCERPIFPISNVTLENCPNPDIDRMQAIAKGERILAKCLRFQDLEDQKGYRIIRDSWNRVFDANTGKELFRFPVGEGACELAVSNEGRYILSTGCPDNLPMGWRSGEDGTMLGTIPLDPGMNAEAVAISENGWILAGTSDSTQPAEGGKMSLFSTQTKKMMWTGNYLSRTTANNQDAFYGVHENESPFFQEGNALILLNSDLRSYRVLETATGNPLLTIPLSWGVPAHFREWYPAFRFFPDHKKIFILQTAKSEYGGSSSNDPVVSIGRIQVWDLQEKRVVFIREFNQVATEPGSSASIMHMSISPDGSRLMVGKPGLRVGIFDAMTGEELQVLTFSADVPLDSSLFSYGIFLKDNTRALTLASPNPYLFDVTTGTRLPYEPHVDRYCPDGGYVSNPFLPLQQSEDGTLLLTVNQDCDNIFHIQRWDFSGL